MNFKNFDLNLLRVFIAIYRARSVSKAAVQVGLTQAAMSNALRRLRDQCDDPLFVRSSGAMEPTALATALAPPLQDALDAIERSLTNSIGFDPLTSARTFRLLTSDVGERVVLPKLMLALKTVAPEICIEAIRIPQAEYVQALRSGNADLAIGNIAFLQRGFYQQLLFEDRYLCIARTGHPNVNGELTLDAYLAEDHVVSMAGSTDSLVDDALASLQRRRKIKLKVTHYYGASAIVTDSDLIATVPENAVSGMASLQKLSLPFTIPGARIRQFWHRRAHKDPANQWLRTVIAGLIRA
jgi:DNA-binding transcriptional LysR family regulator